MESLLSLAFDNISSREAAKIRKGLRQIEGLLAQICLFKAPARSPRKRQSEIPQQEARQEAKGLRELREDAAFREFFRLQEGFQCNVASRLIATLERLLGMPGSSANDLVILSALELLQGMLLLHPPSRTLFSREIYLNILLDLLDSANPPKLQAQALLVLMTALLDCPENTRTFEDMEGLLTVVSVFKSRGTGKEVRMRAWEFLYFYLMPEVSPSGVRSSSAPNTAVLQRSPSKMAVFAQHHARTHSGDSGGGMDLDEDDGTRTMEEKKEFLGRYLEDVDELVDSMHENGMFAAG